MRIGFNFHTTDDYISGVEYYSMGLLNALLENDTQNQYIVFTNKPEIVRAYAGERFNLTVMDCSFIKNRISRIFWEHVTLPRILKKERIDILHCPHYICPVVKSSVPYVVTIHDTIAIDHPGMCKISNAIYYKMLMRSSVKTAAKVIAVSAFTRERIQSNFGTKDSSVTVINPGIDKIFNTCCDSSEQEQVRIKYNLPDKYILYVGNIEPKKNILKLLEAFKILKDRGLPHSLVIIGKRTWKSGAVWDYIKSAFSPDDVLLAGYGDRQDMSMIYKSAQCHVSVSLCEGFGFPAMEAFACGVPVVSSCTGILNDINEQAYTRIDPCDSSQIAEGISRIINDGSLRQRQIACALTEVSKFSWKSCAIQTLACYREAIS